MSVDKIKELIELMNENELVEMEVEQDDLKVRLKKAGANMPVVAAAPMAAAPVAAAHAAAAPAMDDPNLVPIESPIVGTFYRSPSPESDPFVKEGDQIGQDSVVCIVEAMKIMNEVKSGMSGTIEKILIENGEPVEYGQPLFMVRKA